MSRREGPAATAALAGRLRNLFSTSPLRHGAFRAFYFASVGAAVGYTMQATVSSWLMASLGAPAVMVALVLSLIHI